MGTQGPGRKRIPNKERLTAEDDALNVIAREAEARLAAKRAARAEAREIRMKELERQQKEIYQVQKKYYGLDSKDNKWGDIEQWMEDSERYSRHARRHASISDDEERMSVSSRGSVRSDLDAVGAFGGLGSERGSTSHSHKKSKKKKKKHSKANNGYDDDYSTVSGWSSKLSDESRHSRSSRLDPQLGSFRSTDLYSNSSLPSSRLQSSGYNGYQGSLYEDSVYSSCSSRRYTGSANRVSSEYSGFLGSSSRTSSRANSACASPVEDCGGSVASFLRSAATTSGLPRDLDHVTIPDLSNVDDRLERDYLEKGSRVSTLSSATLASLGGTSSRRGSGDTSITADTEASVREIKEIHELKDQIQDVEAKYMQSLKEVKDTLVEMEEKYRKAMVSNAQLDNEKCNLMYQVDIQKDSLMELEELLTEMRREYEEKTKELEREKHAHSILQFQFNELKQTLKQSEELLTEIRQLHLQRDGYVREIADLQETLEWKDKKIGALERQKEYSDAIRSERDELRDEVVQLKDVLKKHGIVLGPDLDTNGETGESVLDGPCHAESDTKTSPTEGSSVLGRSEEKQSEVEAVEALQQNQLDEALPQNHVTSPALSGCAEVIETLQSEEPRAPPIESDEEIESGNTINTESNKLCSDPEECVHLTSVVGTGSEEELTRENSAGLEASASSVENCGKEMDSAERYGLDPKVESQQDQTVEEVCAREPTTEYINKEVEEWSATDKSENGNASVTEEGIPSVHEIFVSIDNSEDSEEKPSEKSPEGAVDLSSTSVVAAEEEASHQEKTKETEAITVSEEDTEATAPQTLAKAQQPQGTSASGKKKKKKKKGKHKSKGGAQNEARYDKDSKLQEERSQSKDPGQKNRADNLGKAAGSCESPEGSAVDSNADGMHVTATKDDATLKELENEPCFQTSNHTDHRRDIPEQISSGDSPTETSEAHPNPESDIRKCHSDDLESKPDMFRLRDDADYSPGSQNLIDTTELSLSADKDYCLPEITTVVQNDTVAGSNNTDEQEYTEISVNVSESIVNTDALESQDQDQVRTDGPKMDTQINAQQAINPKTQLPESELSVANSGDLPEDTHASNCLDNDLVEQRSEECSVLLTDSLDTQSQFSESESVEPSQAELTLHLVENAASHNDTTESPPDTGGNTSRGTETQPKETEETADAHLQSGEHLTLTDGEREQTIQNETKITALSDNNSSENPREVSPEASNDEPEDEVGEEFQFEDQDLEALPDSPKSPSTEGIEEERTCPMVEVHEGQEDNEGQDQKSNGTQVQSNVKEDTSVGVTEGRGKTEYEKLETRLDPEFTGQVEGSAGEEHKTEESGMDQSPAKNKQPLDNVEVASEATEIGEVVARGEDSEGASQVVEVKSGQEGPTRKDSKKGGKKNKGKGKEDCKMS